MAGTEAAHRLAAALGPQPSHVTAGVCAAVGVWDLEVLGRCDTVAGWYAPQADTTVVWWLLLTGTLVRFETTATQSLTITVPLTRVSRVVDTAAAGRHSLMIELDADAVTITPATVGGDTVDRSLRTTYTELATTPTSVTALMVFSAALRRSLR